MSPRRKETNNSHHLIKKTNAALSALEVPNIFKVVWEYIGDELADNKADASNIKKGKET